MAFSLGQLDQAIDRSRSREEFHLAGRPAYLNVCEIRLGAEAEVDTEIVRRVVAGAAAHLIDPEALCRVEGHARSFCIAVGRRADETQAETAVLILGEG